MDIQRVLDAWARENTRLAGFDLPDPIAMAVALDPAVATETRRLFVAVETGGTWGRGQTVVDHLAVTGREPNVEVVTSASRVRFLKILHAGRTGAQASRCVQAGTTMTGAYPASKEAAWT